MWDSVWSDQLKAQWTGADMMVRLGGQVDLRKMAQSLLCSLVEDRELFERMNMLKKAYYASDASLPLKTQLELFMKEDVPE